MGGRGGCQSARRRRSTISTAVVEQRIQSCNLTNLPVDDIADHLYSTYPDYKQYKLIPFRSKIRQIHQHSRRRPRTEQTGDNNDSDPCITSPKRRRHVCQETDTSDSSGSPQHDMMKSMLRTAYKRDNTQHSNSGVTLGDEEGLRKECRIIDVGDGPRFKDFGGIKKQLQELEEEVLLPMRYPKLLQWLKVKPVSGILLHGIPGCGKTRLAHAIANETGFKFYSKSAPELVSGVSGGSEENIRELFSEAYKTAPSIIFIDEFDAIASKRDTLQRETERRIVTQLLTCMDDSHRPLKYLAENANSEHADMQGYVLVIGATNRPDALDPALRRPGRFDKEIELPPPDENARADILITLAQNMRVASDFNAKKIARKTPGFVGADLTHLAHKAGIVAINRIIRQRRAELNNEEAKSAKESLEESWSPEDMKKLSTSMIDFEEAAKMVQPSLTREGFPDTLKSFSENGAGMLDLRKECERDVIMSLKYPALFKKAGVKLQSGLLLFGPPGCGKTMFVKELARKAGVNFMYIKGPELLSKYVGDSEFNVRTLFLRARRAAPCILFFDEVDTLTTKRGNEGAWVVERLLTQLMIELDGGEDRTGVYVIGATNRLEMIDQALMRHGRFGKVRYVPLPSPEDRGLILQAQTKGLPIDESLDLRALGESDVCENFSCADLAKLIEEARKALLEEMLDGSEEELERRVSASDESEFTLKYVHVEQALRNVSPSVSQEQKLHYEKLAQRFAAA